MPMSGNVLLIMWRGICPSRKETRSFIRVKCAYLITDREHFGARTNGIIFSIEYCDLIYIT